MWIVEEGREEMGGQGRGPQERSCGRAARSQKLRKINSD